MPSCEASEAPLDPEALIAAWIASSIAAARDRFAYSRADCICGRSCYLTNSYGLHVSCYLVCFVQFLDRSCAALKTIHELHEISRSEEHTSELQSQSNLVCRLL